MKPHGRPDPRFDIDLAYGREAENLVAQYMTWLGEGSDKLEVKRKRYCDLSFYVETHCDRGRSGTYEPSGILTTTAAAWTFVIDRIGLSITFPTAELRAMLDDASSRDKEETDGDCPTRGKLVSLNVLVYRHRRRAERERRQAAAPPVTAADIHW